MTKAAALILCSIALLVISLIAIMSAMSRDSSEEAVALAELSLVDADLLFRVQRVGNPGRPYDQYSRLICIDSRTGAVSEILTAKSMNISMSRLGSNVVKIAGEAEWVSALRTSVIGKNGAVHVLYELSLEELAEDQRLSVTIKEGTGSD